MTKLNPPETAPKDRQILIDIGSQQLFAATWCKVSRKWVYAALCVESYMMGGEDRFFESEYTTEILGWLPFPEKGGENNEY